MRRSIQTLVEEVHKMTATAQKRKLRLKERSQKRKLKKGGKAGEEKVSTCGCWHSD
jgi:hypothetical protein